MISRYSSLNKLKYDSVYGVLHKAPIVGLYRNQKPRHWRSFFTLFCTFLRSQQGPRGDAIKMSRQYLQKNKKMTKQMLKPLNLSKNYLVRDVYIKFKSYVPSPLYIRYKIDSERLQEVEQNVRLFLDKESHIFQRIVKGLVSKHGNTFDIDSKMKEIVKVYLNKFAAKQQEVRAMEAELKLSEEYLKYEKMRIYLQPVIEMFDKVERQIGLSNVQRGKIFEEKCQAEGLQELFARLGRSNYKVVTNARWEPSELGEVDIALIEPIDGVETVTVLIECKARLFDIRAGVRQIGPERIQKNKRFLKIKKQVVPVLDKAQYFVMTSMPCNQYHLPFQSKLKAELEKATKGFAYSELSADRTYNILSTKFNNETSPLDWFNEQAAQHLIIV